jgi:methylenetetrahydrofolate--tRNA-(uracil-5-)-methyltransferase
MVGFQTRLKFGEQKRVFSMIPALARAEFVRYGVMHRNTFINPRGILEPTYRLKKDERIFFAGQLSGVEGYVESAASGLVAGLNAGRAARGLSPLRFPPETAVGALAEYIGGEEEGDFQPINVNFGIMPGLGMRARGKRQRNAEISARALRILDEMLKNTGGPRRI